MKHVNRDTLKAVFHQKRIHGNGRGQFLLTQNKNVLEWIAYFSSEWYRHFISPFFLLLRFEIGLDNLIYTALTNTIFWGAAFEILLTRRTQRHI